MHRNPQLICHLDFFFNPWFLCTPLLVRLRWDAMFLELCYSLRNSDALSWAMGIPNRNINGKSASGNVTLIPTELYLCDFI